MWIKSLQIISKKQLLKFLQTLIKYLRYEDYEGIGTFNSYGSNSFNKAVIYIT